MGEGQRTFRPAHSTIRKYPSSATCGMRITSVSEGVWVRMCLFFELAALRTNLLMSRCQARSSSGGRKSAERSAAGVTSIQALRVPRVAPTLRPVLPEKPRFCSQSLRLAGKGLEVKMVMAMLVVGPW